MPTQFALPSIPELHSIRAVIVTDLHTEPLTPLVMIFRESYAIRISPDEIDSLIGQLRGCQIVLAAGINDNATIDSNRT